MRQRQRLERSVILELYIDDQSRLKASSADVNSQNVESQDTAGTEASKRFEICRRGCEGHSVMQGYLNTREHRDST